MIKNSIKRLNIEFAPYGVAAGGFILGPQGAAAGAFLGSYVFVVCFAYTVFEKVSLSKTIADSPCFRKVVASVFNFRGARFEN